MVRFDHPRNDDTDAAPSLLSILAYPVTWSGLLAVGVVAAVPVVFGLGARQTSLAPIFFTKVGFAIVPFIAVYLAWFVPECVRDSAKGGEQAPSVVLSGVNWLIMISRAVCAMAVVVVFALPVVWYVFEDRLTFVVSLNPPREHRSLGLLILLGTWAAVFTPMGLLSMAMHASLDAVSPRFLTDSIRRVLAPYARLAAGITAYVVVAWLLLDRLYSQTSSIPLRACATGAFAYGILVFAHILGRFYRRHSDALDWEL